MNMNELWEVFLTPHTDDEVIGMAGAIVRAKRAGLKVLVVLVTDNVPSSRGRRLFPLDNLSAHRRAEWLHAMETLDVDELDTWEMSEVRMDTHPWAVQDEIQHRIDAVCSFRHVVHLHTVWGTDDVNIICGYGSLAHALCANAASHFARTHPDTLVSLHGVYVYSKHTDDRGEDHPFPVIKHVLTEHEHERKLIAMDCYKASPRSIGYGYASVPELFRHAEQDPTEYIIDVTCPSALFTETR